MRSSPVWPGASPIGQKDLGALHSPKKPLLGQAAPPLYEKVVRSWGRDDWGLPSRTRRYSETPPDSALLASHFQDQGTILSFLNSFQQGFFFPETGKGFGTSPLQGNSPPVSLSPFAQVNVSVLHRGQGLVWSPRPCSFSTR